ncbi:MAG TPA: DMT family transporter [Candidatus Thalassarchaeaceae archaeon]|jgi:drug/metabolite transporter (DMT)-like permease|nr:DMT family transporter [Candidatus Thalassarchaeaceae archaeon]
MAESEGASAAKSFFDGGIILHTKLLFVAASWGLAWVAGRELATSLPEAIAAWYRYAITVPLFFIWLYFSERVERDGKTSIFIPRGEMIWKIIWVGFFSTFLYQLLFMHGMARTAAGDASVIITFNPLFTALLAVPLLNRRISARLFIGLLVGLFGVVVVTGWSPNNNIPFNVRLVGDLLIMCAAASWAVSTNLIKKILDDENSDVEGPSALAIVAWSSLMGWVLLTPLASFDFIAYGSDSIPNNSGWLWIFYLAVASTVISYVWFAEGIEKIGATATATYVYLVPFFGILSGIIILGESVSWSLFAGLLLILFGVKISLQASNEHEE